MTLAEARYWFINASQPLMEAIDRREKVARTLAAWSSVGTPESNIESLRVVLGVYDGDVVAKAEDMKARWARLLSEVTGK